MSSGCQLQKNQQRFNLAYARLAKDPEVTQENKDLIIRFCKNKVANGITSSRAVKLVYTLRYWAHWLKTPFSQATKDDLVSLVGDLEAKGYSEWSKHDFKVILKLFYKWFKGNDEEFPQEVKWIKPRLRNAAHKLPEELLTEEEVLRIVKAANHLRDRALILVLYESGCRIGELLSLKMKNVQFDEYGAVLRVSGKTGDRRVRIINAVPALTAWIDLYEHSGEPDASLWPPRSNQYYQPGEPAEAASIYVMLRKLGKKAGIRKKIYPHLFRHSRATVLASKLTEAQMNEYFGWTQGSEMPSTYVHLSGRDVDNTLIALYGAKTVNTQPVVSAIQNKLCPRCKEANSPTNRYCCRCGSVLDAGSAILSVATTL